MVLGFQTDVSDSQAEFEKQALLDLREDVLAVWESSWSESEN